MGSPVVTSPSEERVVRPPAIRSARLTELDALRGLAALSVVLYHYTFRFGELYGPWPVDFQWKVGHFGVQLFFVISGFVIFMTVQKIERLRDFALSRFLRLFPLYWAAVLVTWTVVRLAGPHDREVGVRDMLVNLTMLQSWFGVPHVDGVYWTLTVELTFYVIMGLAIALKATQGKRLAVILGSWLALSLAVRAGIAGRVIPFDDLLATNMGTAYSHLFVAGVCSYLGWSRGHTWVTRLGMLWALIVPALARDLPGLLATVVIMTIFELAIRGRFGFLGRSWMTKVGFISYGLYLVHQNLGYTALAFLRDHLPADIAVVVAVLAALALAAALTYGWEQPVRRALRSGARSLKPFQVQGRGQPEKA